MIKMRYHIKQQKKIRLRRRALMARLLTVIKFNELSRAQRRKNHLTYRMNLLIHKLNNYSTAEKQGYRKPFCYTPLELFAQHLSIRKNTRDYA